MSIQCLSREKTSPTDLSSSWISGNRAGSYMQKLLKEGRGSHLALALTNSKSLYTQSIYPLSYWSHSPDVWSHLKHPQLSSSFHWNGTLGIQQSLWRFVLVPVSAATQHQNQTLQSYYLYYCYLFWLILPNYTHREGNLYLDSSSPGNLIHPVGWLSCFSSGGLRFVPQVVPAPRAARNQAEECSSLDYTVLVYTILTSL